MADFLLLVVESDSDPGLSLGLWSLEGKLSPVFVPRGRGKLMCGLGERAYPKAQLTFQRRPRIQS